MHLDGSPVQASLVSQMTAAIEHRGPDGEGIWFGEGVVLGHRRLAILAPGPAGDQPMLTTDARFVLTFNGELYNHHGLRAELIELGHRFHTRTDSEVVLHAFAEWGTDCVQRFNGMFAFAIWDGLKRSLCLARDRYGVKPLYYSFCGRSLLFGSEVKALLAHPCMSATVDHAALGEYFTFQNVLSDRTLFAGIKSLPRGHLMKVEVGSAGLPRTTQFWDYHFAPDSTLDQQTSEVELGRLLKQAVTRQMEADVPLGSYLSGGIDSGSIVGVAAQHQPGLPTFTCGFSASEGALDERETAAALSHRFATTHHAIELDASDAEQAMHDLIWHLEEPCAGQSYPNFYAARLASRHVRVVLSGTGGDELFAGYPWRYRASALTCQTPSDFLNRQYGWWQRLIPSVGHKSFFCSSIQPDLDGHNIRDLFTSAHADNLSTARTPSDFVNQSLYFELTTFLPSLLLVEDKLHMAHHVEARVPFLDNDLVDFALQIPAHLKLRDLNGGAHPGYRTSDGKRILRAAAATYLPSPIVEAPKQGFSGPDADWYRGPCRRWLQRVFLENDSPVFSYLQRSTVRQVVSSHLAGSADQRLLIWSLLSFDAWLHTFTH